MVLTHLFVFAEHEAAMVKYSRLPKKRENEKVALTVAPFEFQRRFLKSSVAIRHM